MKYALIFIFSFLHINLVSTDSKPKLQALLIADTSAPELRDASLADLLHIENSLAAIAYHTGIDFQARKLTDATCSVESIQKMLLSLTADSNDIVFFYYTGHGSMDPYGSRWPVITPSNNRDLSLPGSLIANFFRQNKHRLDVILFDCCNFSMSDQRRLERIKGLTCMLSKRGSYPGLKKLFLQNRGLIIGCASAHHEYAIGCCSGPTPGGLFTTGFLEALKKVSEKSKSPTWDLVFKKTRDFCIHESSDSDILFSTIQHPVFTFERR